ncbi:MAG: NfeD family protein [Acidobacteria bacterium]|nr:NfeD family protein [Acidobacteriota bacterium]
MEYLKEWLKPDVIWFIVGIVLMLLEMAVPGLVIIFFGIGAIAVSVTCMIASPSLTMQLVIFIVVSGFSLALLRRWLKTRFFSSKDGLDGDPTVLDEFTGKTAVVDQPIAPGRPGKVEFKGTHWKAEAEEKIATGEIVVILEKDNITLKVSKSPSK